MYVYIIRIKDTTQRLEKIHAIANPFIAEQNVVAQYYLRDLARNN